MVKYRLWIRRSVQDKLPAGGIMGWTPSVNGPPRGFPPNRLSEQ